MVADSGLSSKDPAVEAPQFATAAHGTPLNLADDLPERPRVADHIYLRLRDAILSNQLSPGSRLSVPSIARQFGVSRSPVREAVQRLVQDGLASEEPHRGAVVTSLKPEELVSLYQVREVLEGLAVRLAAEHATRDELAAMQVTLQQQTDAVERGDLQQHIVLDLRFHALIREAARNDDLTEFLERVQSKVMIAMLSGDSATWPKQAVAEHRRILEAILAGDADAAEAAARAHVVRVREAIAGLGQESRQPAS